MGIEKTLTNADFRLRNLNQFLAITKNPVTGYFDLLTVAIRKFVVTFFNQYKVNVSFNF